MKMEDLLKWAAVALGAYWLIQQFQKSQAPPPAPAPAPAPQPQPQLPPAGGEGETAQAQVLLITQAAVDPIVAAQLGESIRMNSDQWNYYRSQGGGDVPPVDIFPPENRNYQMTAIEYHEARAVHLRGLGRAVTGAGGYVS